MITEEQIFRVEEQEVFGDYVVKRINMDEFDVIRNGKIIFTGEDFEVTDFINSVK